MTPEMRRLVADLLRESARIGGIAAAYHHVYNVDIEAALGQPGGREAHPIWESAVRARVAVSADAPRLDYAEMCRIAAARVEEGRWP